MVVCAVKLYTALTLIAPAIFLEVERLSAVTVGNNACTLSALQVNSIQGAIERNASCTYSMTVDSVIGIQ
jgi:hypothetical protein